MNDRLGHDLSDVVGAKNVLMDPELRAPYERDITGRWRGTCRLVVRPETTNELSDAVTLCHGAGVPMVPQGGNTGLVGGTCPRLGEVLLSLERLRRIDVVDVGRLEVTADAGATLEQLQESLAGTGAVFPIDLAARGSATLGGMAATDAGGAMALRYGTMRAQVLGLEAVLADGGVVERMASLRKDNAGYALPRILVGSEGTLGVISRLRLRLVRRPAHRVAALCGVDSHAAAADLLRRLEDAQIPLEAADFFDHAGMELIGSRHELRPPLRSKHSIYVSLQVGDDDDPTVRLATALDGGAHGDVVVADDEARRRALWAYREGLNEAVSAAGVPLKIDVSVPVERVAEFCEQVRSTVEKQDGRRLYLWGHLGDGNVHVNVIGDPREYLRIESGVLQMAVGLGGSISAEHGIGRAKCAALVLMRSAADLAAMRALKRAFDPENLLNPGCVLPDETRAQLPPRPEGRDALMPESIGLYQRAVTHMPGGNTRTTVYVAPRPPYIVRGSGYVVTDADGRELIDLQNNYTALIHGHAHPVVIAAACSAVECGTSFGMPTPVEIDLAQMLASRLPHAVHWRFANSGTEAVMFALRTARAYTGRREIVRFGGSYHGGYDDVLDPAPGLMPATDSAVHVVPQQDAERFMSVMTERGDQVAAVIVDFMPNRAGLKRLSTEFVQTMVRLTRDAGAVLIADEVITFRLETGGLQTRYGVQADITTLGKMIGGGLPVGAFGGSAAVMACLDPSRPDRVAHGGTFAANPVVMHAGLATMQLLDAAAISRINTLGDRLRRRLVETSFEVNGDGSLARIVAGERQEDVWWRLYHAGVLICGNGLMAVSTSMDERVIDEVAERIVEALR